MFEINGLYTDHYELTMAQGYFLSGKYEKPACFDYFFRKNPFKGGYVIFTGLADLLESLTQFRFSLEDLSFLSKAGFRKEFLQYLAEFTFRGDLYSPEEGEIVFPFEPVMRVEGTILETQVIETILLNIINFQSLIATKASRMRKSAGNRLLLDFGLRRAQGLGGIYASRAAMIGGCDSTSNVFSAQRYGLPSGGTMAHSWVQSYQNELAAFKDFGRFYPNSCILLADTYDTLKTGVPNAIKLAKELEKQGGKLTGIRLDSGDLGYLSKAARKMLDENGLKYVKIFVSNQLDEYLIKSLIDQDAPVDGFGVGTKLVTGGDDAALDGIYKLSEFNRIPQMKISDNIEKMTLPGKKNVIRYYDENAMIYCDAIILEEEPEIEIMFHPFQHDISSRLPKCRNKPLLKKMMYHGKAVMNKQKIEEIAENARENLSELPDYHKRFENPHIYKVGISEKVRDLRDKLISEIRQRNQ